MPDLQPTASRRTGLPALVISPEDDHELFTVAFVVMTAGTDWAVVVPAIAGAIGIGGIVGAIITTYGGRGRMRRDARSKVLASLEEIELTRRTLPLAEGTYYDLAAFAKLGTECLIAGVPRSVVTTYDQICNASRRFTLSVTSGSGGTAEFDAVMASLWLSDKLPA